MKKILITAIVLMLAAIFAFAAPLSAGMQASAATEPQVLPLTFSGMDIAPLAASTEDGPGDYYSEPVYTKDNEQIYFLKEVGLLVTYDGRPIMDTTNSTITKFNLEAQEYVTGADTKMSVYLNSFLDKRYLRSGSIAVTAIKLDREIFMIHFRSDEVEKFIYTYREKVDYGIATIFHPGAWFNTEYRYYDMNGNLIDNKYIADWDTATILKSVGANLLYFAINPVLFFGTLIFGGPGNFSVPFVEIYKKTTLEDLRNELREEGFNPLPKVQGTVTEDGMNIYVRSTTNQCVDFFNYPLFNIANGLPLVYHDGSIIAVDSSAMYEMYAQGGVLRNVVSTEQLLDDGVDFYITKSKTTPMGELDTVVVNFSKDKNHPDWRFPNGDSAGYYIVDTILGTSLDGPPWSDVGGIINSGINGIRSFINGATDLFWITVAIVLLVVLFPVWWALLKILLKIISVPVKWLAGKLGV